VAGGEGLRGAGVWRVLAPLGLLLAVMLVALLIAARVLAPLGLLLAVMLVALLIAASGVLGGAQRPPLSTSTTPVTYELLGP
jgi:hypothetical protein